VDSLQDDVALVMETGRGLYGEGKSNQIRRVDSRAGCRKNRTSENYSS